MLTSLPTARPLGPVPSLRWGIAAPGDIAEKFTTALKNHSQQLIVGVGSRSAKRAETFAKRHGIPASYGSYESLMQAPDIDVVYIAAPHNAHAELAMLAIAAGKHVLVEKPFATTATEARYIAEAARSAGVFAMEGMWTRYLPQADVVRQLLDANAIGEITLVTADFGFSLPFDPKHRMYDPSLAGGALLDAGIYPLAFVSSVLGKPTSLTATGTISPTGVEDQALLSLDYGAAQAAILTTIRAAVPVRATIMGSEGVIEIDSPFIAASGVTLSQRRTWRREHHPVVWRDSAFTGIHDAMSYEADALASFVGADLTESPVHPLDEVISVLEMIDAARAQLGADRNSSSSTFQTCESTRSTN